MRRKSRQLQRHEAVAAVNLHRGDVAAAARRLGKNPQYVARWNQQFQAEGHLNDKPRSGRPSLCSYEVVEKVFHKVLQLQSVPAATAALIASGDLPACIAVSTVYRNLRKHFGHRLVFGRQKYIPNITPATAARRLAFANHHLEHGTEWSCTTARCKSSVAL